MRIFNILLSKNNSYLLSVLEDDNISNIIFNDIIQESGLILNKNLNIQMIKNH